MSAVPCSMDKLSGIGQIGAAALTGNGQGRGGGSSEMRRQQGTFVQSQ